MKCCICKGRFREGQGHNAEPVKSGRCCERCNVSVVIPKRLEKKFGDW